MKINLINMDSAERMITPIDIVAVGLSLEPCLGRGEELFLVRKYEGGTGRVICQLIKQK